MANAKIHGKRQNSRLPWILWIHDFRLALVRTRWKKDGSSILVSYTTLTQLQTPLSCQKYPWTRDETDLLRCCWRKKWKLPLQSWKRIKSPGADKITAEEILAAGQQGVDTMYDLCRKIWEEEEVPNGWKQSVIVPVFKKEDRLCYDNYRWRKWQSHVFLSCVLSGFTLVYCNVTLSRPCCLLILLFRTLLASVSFMK